MDVSQKMARSSKIPQRNRNATGWWVYCEVERWIPHQGKKLTPRSRCTVWENTRIIKAKSREEAYAKAMRLSGHGGPTETVGGGEWRFAGISELLPIYEELGDGAEILWTNRGTMTLSGLRLLIKSKKQLSVFDDSKERKQQPDPTRMGACETY